MYVAGISDLESACYNKNVPTGLLSWYANKCNTGQSLELHQTLHLQILV